MKTKIENTSFEREIRFIPAFDKRNEDPKKDYGVTSMEIVFMLQGEKGTVHLIGHTGMDLKHIRERNKFKNYHSYISGSDKGYHSHTPMYEGQEPTPYNCLYLGKPCYCDGSALAGVDLWEEFIAEGEEHVWRELLEYYYKVFESENHGGGLNELIHVISRKLKEKTNESI